MPVTKNKSYYRTKLIYVSAIKIQFFYLTVTICTSSSTRNLIKDLPSTLNGIRTVSLMMRIRVLELI